MIRNLLLFICVIFGVSLLAQNFTNGYNFNLPADDATAQEYLPHFEAKTISDFLSINDAGNFHDGENEIRFWGVNLTSAGNFPDKEQADFIAARMRKMGINLVRFHHMDNPWANQDGSIFDRSTGGTRVLHPTSLDRLHYFLASLKKNNIYANINLHVSRTFSEADGVAGADQIQDFGKAVTYYDPQLIELQKEYATQLLTSINPYTNLKLADDPVIGLVEITNENTLYGWWKGDRLRPISSGGSLITRHDDLLNDLWHKFLSNKYGDHSTLKVAWENNSNGSPGSQLIRDPGFESGDITDNWALELHESANGMITADNTEKLTGEYSAKVDVLNLTPTNWHFQFKQERLSMKKDSSYVIRFYAKANKNMALNIVLQRGEDPWTYYGGTSYSLSTEWQQYIFSIKAPEDNDEATRVSFNFEETGTAWFDDFEMTLATKNGFNEGENLSSENIERTTYSQRSLFSNQRIADLAEFYISIQRNYYQDMVAFLKNEIGVKVPITGTNALVGPADVLSQVDLDYIDDHAYWDHPQFPSTPWDSYDWFIENESMLKNLPNSTLGNIMSGLAMSDRPYTISEYNHPYPNQYQPEMIPLLAAYMSLHEVDGLMIFEYHGGPHNDWDNDVVNSYFSINRNNAVMSLMPIYAYAYRKGLINPAKNSLTVDYTPNTVYQMFENDNSGRWGKFIPYDKQIAFSQTVKTGSYDASNSVNFQSVPTINTSRHTTEQIEIDGVEGILKINAPQIQSITGFLQNSTPSKTANLEISSASDFGQVGLLSLTQDPIEFSDKLLLFCSSEQQNSSMQWDGPNTVHNNWGSSPSLIKALKLNITLKLSADSIALFPLEPTGATSNVSFTKYPNSNGLYEIEINQDELKTPWVGINVFSTPTPNAKIKHEESVLVFPNPTKDLIHIEWPNTLSIKGVDLYNSIGQLVVKFTPVYPGQNNLELTLRKVPNGEYFVRLHEQNRKLIKKISIVK